MKAQLIFKRRIDLSENAFAELVLWRLPQPVRGSTHTFKYSLAYAVEGECVLRYDNEAGKGDHRHFEGIETTLNFSDPDALLAEFWKDVRRWDDENLSS